MLNRLICESLESSKTFCLKTETETEVPGDRDFVLEDNTSLFTSRTLAYERNCTAQVNR